MNIKTIVFIVISAVIDTVISDSASSALPGKVGCYMEKACQKKPGDIAISRYDQCLQAPYVKKQIRLCCVNKCWKD